MRFSTYVSAVLGVLGVAIVLLQLALNRLKSLRRSDSGNVEFKAFQRTFIIGYLLCLFSDSLQSPYLYYLYHSYGFLESQVAILYVCGFATSLVFSFISIRFADRVEKRLACLCCIGINSVSCLLKLSDTYTVLLVSRIMDGIAGSLLSTAFTNWYIFEHVERNDFPKEWLSNTFNRVALFGGYLAIAAGFVAQWSESTIGITAAPFLLATPILLAAGGYIVLQWNPNQNSIAMKDPLSVGFSESVIKPADSGVTSGVSSTKLWPQLQKVFAFISKDPISFLLSTVQSLFESVLYMVVFLWTPMFLQGKREILYADGGNQISFGLIYACLMAGVLLGLLVQRFLTRRAVALNLLPVAVAVSFVSMVTLVVVTYPNAKELDSSKQSNSDGVLVYKVLLSILCTYELGVGMYFPLMQRLQRDFLPVDLRPAVLAVFRMPLNLLVCAGLLILHRMDSPTGNWMIMTICTLLLLLCLLSALLLQNIVKRRANSTQTDSFNSFIGRLANDEDDI